MHNQFFMHGPKCENKHFWLGGGLGRHAMIRLDIAFQLSSHPYLCTCKIRKPYDKNLKYEKQIVHILGALGGPSVKHRVTNISGR